MADISTYAQDPSSYRVPTRGEQTTSQLKGNLADYNAAYDLATAFGSKRDASLKNALELQKLSTEFKSSYISPEQARARILVQLSLLTDASGNQKYPGAEKGTNDDANGVVDLLIPSTQKNPIAVTTLDKFIEDIKNRGASLVDQLTQKRTLASGYLKKGTGFGAYPNIKADQDGTYNLVQLGISGSPFLELQKPETKSKADPTGEVLDKIKGAVQAADIVLVKYAKLYKPEFQVLMIDAPVKFLQGPGAGFTKWLGGAGAADLLKSLQIRSSKDPNWAVWQNLEKIIGDARIKNQTGAAGSEAEYVRILSEMPDIRLLPDQFQAQLKDLMERTAQEIQLNIDSYNLQSGLETAAKKAVANLESGKTRFPLKAPSGSNDQTNKETSLEDADKEAADLMRGIFKK